MHGLHARIPKHFVLEERLERYATAIEILPSHLAGQWAEACYPLSPQGLGCFSQVWLDLGCGKGAFTCDMARLHPDVLVVGIDSEPVCIAYAAQKLAKPSCTTLYLLEEMPANFPTILLKGNFHASISTTPHLSRESAMRSHASPMLKSS